jgi:hypothetical protein
MTDHVVSFSGGMGSFAEAYYCVQEFGKENVVLLFCDTLTEDPDLYRFLDECVKFLDCRFVRLSREKTVWDLFKEQKFIANTRLDLCSRVLKRDLMSKECLPDNYGITIYKYGLPLKSLSCEVHVGIDFSEHHRLTSIQKNMYPKTYRSLLVEKGLIVSKDFSEQFLIRRPYLYTLGFSHNNCGSFCVKAGLGQFKMMFEKLPERYTYHEEKEQEVLAIGGLPFLRKTTNGKKRYLSMKEYREEYLEQGKADSDKHDIGGCACALPMGDEEDGAN